MSLDSFDLHECNRILAFQILAPATLDCDTPSATLELRAIVEGAS